MAQPVGRYLAHQVGSLGDQFERAVFNLKAKALLEAYIRQLAVELAPRNIKCNAIQAGVTDTPALRLIPGHEDAIELTLRRNPYKRLTTPEDVAKTIVAFSAPELAWMSGNVIRVDGGEDVAVG